MDSLSGEALFHYYTNDSEDHEYASIVAMLPIATMDIVKTHDILVRCEKENKKLIAVYPQDKTNISSFEFVGAIRMGICILDNYWVFVG